MGSVACVMISFWLLSVVTVVLPRQNLGQVPLWSVVMVGFFAYGSLSWFAVQHERAPEILRTLLLPASAGAVLLGAYALVDNELRYRRTGDWEGYLALMGVALAGHGTMLLLHLLLERRRRARGVAI